MGDAGADLERGENETVEGRLAEGARDGVEGARPIGFPRVHSPPPGEGEQVVVDGLFQARIQGWIRSPPRAEFPARFPIGLGIIQRRVEKVLCQGIQVFAFMRVCGLLEALNGFFQGGNIARQGGGAGLRPQEIRGLGEVL